MRTDSTLQAAQKLMGDAKARIVLTNNGTTKTYYIDSGDDRIMALNHTEQEWSQVAQTVLQDSSGTVAALDLRGYKAVISWGYGANYSACAPLWTIAQKTDSRSGSIITALSLAGTFNLMNEDRASAAYLPDSSNTDTVKTILTALVEATLAPYSHCKAYTATFDVSTGIIDTFMPKDSFRVYLNDRRLSKIRHLMQHVGYKCRVEADGQVHFFIPTVSGSSYDEEYDDVVTGHNFFEKGVRKRVIIPGYFVVSSHPDHESPFAGFTGFAKDTGYDSLPTELQIRDHKYFRVTGNTQCTNIATNLLLHKQMDAEKGHGFAPMNCLQEVFDYVNITDSKVGSGDTRAGNIGYINRKYLPTGAPEDFSMRFRFGSVAPGQYLGTQPPVFGDDVTFKDLNTALDYIEEILLLMGSEIKDEIAQIEPDAGIPSGGTEGGMTWVTLFDGSTDTPTSKTWSLEAGLPWTRYSQLFFSPIIEEVPGVWVVYIIDRGTNFWKYNITTKEWQELSSPTYVTATGSSGLGTIDRNLYLSPNGTKLACVSDATNNHRGGKRVEIYTIATDTWAASEQVQNMDDETPASQATTIAGLVWADESTIWCWAAQARTGVKDYARCIKYSVGGIFTIYAALLNGGLVHSSPQSAAINAAGTVIYGSVIGATVQEWYKYTIATDTYASGGTLTSGRAFAFASDRDKLWYFDTTTIRQGYIDTADDSENDNQFAQNADTLIGYHFGVSDDATYIITWDFALTVPEMMSATPDGMYLLGTIYADGWSPCIIEMPDWNYTMLVVNTTSNKTYSYDHSIQIWISDGTWEFYITQAIPSYADIRIVYGVF